MATREAANADFRSGQFSRAREAYRSLAASTEDVVELARLHNNWSLCSLKLGDNPDSIAQALACLHFDPLHAKAHLRLASMGEATNEFEHHLFYSAALVPQDPVVKNRLRDPVKAVRTSSCVASLNGSCKGVVVIFPGTYRLPDHGIMLTHSTHILGLGDVKCVKGPCHAFVGEDGAKVKIENISVTEGVAHPTGAAFGSIGVGTEVCLSNCRCRGGGGGITVAKGGAATLMSCQFEDMKVMGAEVTLGGCLHVSKSMFKKCKRGVNAHGGALQVEIQDCVFEACEMESINLDGAKPAAAADAVDGKAEIARSSAEEVGLQGADLTQRQILRNMAAYSKKVAQASGIGGELKVRVERCRISGSSHFAIACGDGASVELLQCIVEYAHVQDAGKKMLEEARITMEALGLKNLPVSEAQVRKMFEGMGELTAAGVHIRGGASVHLASCALVHNDTAVNNDWNFDGDVLVQNCIFWQNGADIKEPTKVADNAFRLRMWGRPVRVRNNKTVSHSKEVPDLDQLPAPPQWFGKETGSDNERVGSRSNAQMDDELSESIRQREWWAGIYDGHTSQWTDDELQQFLVSHGEQVVAKGFASRKSLIDRVDRLLHDLSRHASFKSAVPLKKFDPRRCAVFELSPFKPVHDKQGHYIAGKAQLGFKVSFTSEQLQWMATEQLDGTPLRHGMNPDFDLRLNALAMFRSVDDGVYTHTFQLVQDGVQVEGLAISVKQVVENEGSPVLVVQWVRCTCSGELPSDLGEVMSSSMQPEGCGQGCVNHKMSRHELDCFHRYLQHNRGLLKKKYVERMERDWKPRSGPQWRVSIVAPLVAVQSAIGCDNWQSLKTDLVNHLRCEACGKANSDLEEEGRKLKACQQCLAVWYCSEHCQQGHWKKHKPLCKVQAQADTRGASDVFRAGDTAEITGLISKPELNGSKGRLVDFCEDSGRWVIQFAGNLQKKVLPVNLRRDVGVAKHQNYILPGPSSLAYEDSALFVGVESFVCPIKTEYRPPMPAGWVESMNGNIVEFNCLRKNIHGPKVFVIKCQIYKISQFVMTQDDVGLDPDAQTAMVYDAMRERSILLRMWPGETGDRGKAHRQLIEVTAKYGGVSRHVPKIYLYAKREGATLRVFTGRLPLQAQPF